MGKYFKQISVKEEGNPKQDGTYCTNERQLQFKGGEWYDCGTEVCPPEYYFLSIPPMDAEQIYEKNFQAWYKKELSLKEAMLNAITEASLYPKEGFWFNQVAELCAKAYWDGNLNKGNIDPEVWIKNNLPKIPKGSDATDFGKWLNKNTCNSIVDKNSDTIYSADGYYFYLNQSNESEHKTQKTIEQLYLIFRKEIL